jgi:hypothetical protein
MNNSVLTTLSLPAARLDRFIAHVSRLNDKLKANGAPILEYECSNTSILRYPDGNLYPVIQVSLKRNLDAPVGQVELISMSKVNLVTEVMSHKTYRDLTKQERLAVEHPAGACLCDHCETVRPRVYMYTLKTHEGIKRVGSGCLDKYTGLDYKRWIDAYQNATNEIDKLREMDFTEAVHHAVHPASTFLCEAIELIESTGFKPKSYGASCTGHIAFENLIAKSSDLNETIAEYSHQVSAKAREVLDFLLETEFDPKRSGSDYHNNMKLVAEFGYLTRDQAPLLASSVVAYHEHEIQKQKSLEQSHIGRLHIGASAEKVILEDLTVEYVQRREGRYGESTELRFLDQSGNLIKWKASGRKDLVAGEKINLKGTVADHEEWYSSKYSKLVACTKLKNCKILSDVDLKKAKETPEKKKRRTAMKLGEMENSPF